MQGENRAGKGRNALGEKEGSEKRASGQAGCGVPSLLSFLFPSVLPISVCCPLLAAASGQLA